jgi:Domain of unknown function (DUF5665)
MATKQTVAKKQVKSTKSSLPPAGDIDYTRLGRQVAAIYDTVRPGKRQLYMAALIKGFLAGLGGVLGATIGISILLFLLSMLETIPYVKEVSEILQSTISKQTPQ